MMEDVLCPPLNVPAAVTAIRARLDGLDRDVVHLRDRFDPSDLAGVVARLDAMDRALGLARSEVIATPAQVSGIIARLDAMDRATELMHADYSRVPTDLDRRAAQLEEMIDSRCRMLQKQYDALQKFADTRGEVIRHATDEVREIFSERFRAVDLRFAERDLRFAQIDVDHQKAIEAALVAVTASSDKNERNFTKQIDALQIAANKTSEMLGERIDDLKERLMLREGSTSGMSAMTGWIVAGIMTVTAIVTTMVALYNVVHPSLTH